MIVGGQVSEIEVKKALQKDPTTFGMDIGIDGIDVKGETVRIRYTYTVEYAEGVGHLRMKGVLIAKEEPAKAKAIEDEWKKNKKPPLDYAEMVLAAIAYSGAANGTLLAGVVELPPPLVPPRIEVGKR